MNKNKPLRKLKHKVRNFLGGFSCDSAPRWRDELSEVAHWVTLSLACRKISTKGDDRNSHLQVDPSYKARMGVYIPMKVIRHTIILL